LTGSAGAQPRPACLAPPAPCLLARPCGCCAEGVSETVTRAACCQAPCRPCPPCACPQVERQTGVGGRKGTAPSPGHQLAPPCGCGRPGRPCRPCQPCKAPYRAWSLQQQQHRACACQPLSLPGSAPALAAMLTCPCCCGACHCCWVAAACRPAAGSARRPCCRAGPPAPAAASWPGARPLLLQLRQQQQQRPGHASPQAAASPCCQQSHQRSCCCRCWCYCCRHCCCCRCQNSTTSRRCCCRCRAAACGRLPCSPCARCRWPRPCLRPPDCAAAPCRLPHPCLHLNHPDCICQGGGLLSCNSPPPCATDQAPPVLHAHHLPAGATCLPAAPLPGRGRCPCPCACRRRADRRGGPLLPAAAAALLRAEPPAPCAAAAPPFACADCSQSSTTNTQRQADGSSFQRCRQPRSAQDSCMHLFFKPSCCVGCMAHTHAHTRTHACRHSTCVAWLSTTLRQCVTHASRRSYASFSCALRSSMRCSFLRA
jgi:hypothetical protein